MAYKRISPMPVIEGGTGAQTLTIHGVLLGESTSPIVATTAGQTGQILIGNTGADPAFNALGVNSGLTANGVVIANNNGAFTATAAGLNGQILTGVTGSAPTFQSPAASGITTIDGDSGSVTGSTVTISGGSTGLTTSGSGTVLDLTGTLGIANGGTNATSYTQSNGVVTYNGTRLVNYAGPQISSTGIATNTSQPAFQVYQSLNATNVTGDGTNYKLALDTKVFDQNNNFNTTTNTFTAPVSGRYFFNVAVIYTNMVTSTTVQLQITTTGNTFNLAYMSGSGSVASGGFLGSNGSVFANMAAGDTCTFNVIASGGSGTKTVGVDGNQGLTYAGGYLVC